MSHNLWPEIQKTHLGRHLDFLFLGSQTSQASPFLFLCQKQAPKSRFVTTFQICEFQQTPSPPPLKNRNLHIVRKNSILHRLKISKSQSLKIEILKISLTGRHYLLNYSGTWVLSQINLYKIMTFWYHSKSFYNVMSLWHVSDWTILSTNQKVNFSSWANHRAILISGS